LSTDISLFLGINQISFAEIKMNAAAAAVPSATPKEGNNGSGVDTASGDSKY